MAPAKDFEIATEIGILHQMKKAENDKNFIPASDESICDYMKMSTLEKLRDALLFEQFDVRVEHSLAERARPPFERMLSVV